MVMMELFGMNGAGKTTTVLELQRRVDFELPTTEIERYSYICRNGSKVGKVLRVLLDDPGFCFRMFIMMWKKHGWTWDTIATWFNLCHRGYFYLFEPERRIVLGGGMLHKVWGTYGMFPITSRDREEILAILDHFHCESGYCLHVPKEEVLNRNTNRGHNTFLERRLHELDFIYKNFYEFIEVVKEGVEIHAVYEQSLEGRVSLLEKALNET